MGFIEICLAGMMREQLRQVEAFAKGRLQQDWREGNLDAIKALQPKEREE